MNTSLQTSIDELRRQQLTLELLATILENQLHGTPAGDLLAKQQDLSARASAEIAQLQTDHTELTKRRDAQPAKMGSVKLSGF